jgi:hypothetical protein
MIGTHREREKIVVPLVVMRLFCEVRKELGGLL